MLIYLFVYLFVCLFTQIVTVIAVSDMVMRKYPSGFQTSDAFMGSLNKEKPQQKQNKRRYTDLGTDL